MPHTVIIIEPGKLPRFIQNVQSLRPYAKNPYAVIDPKHFPDAKLEYWRQVSKTKLGAYTSISKITEINNKVSELSAVSTNVKK